MSRRRSALLIALVLIAAFLGAAFGAPAAERDWKEPPYDPVVGSRWLVDSETNEVENRPDGVQTTHTASRGELTVEAKNETGFRIAYVTREISIDGNAPSVEIMKQVLPLFKDWALHARTNAAGKPIEVDNLNEAKATARTFVEKTMAAFKSAPKVASVLRPVFDSLLNADGAEAAKAYLDEVSSLSAWQNTGLKLDETRQETSEAANPFGGDPLKTTATVKIVSLEAKSGVVIVTYVRDSQMDPEAMKKLALDLLQKLSSASDKPLPADAVEMVKGFRLSIDEHDEAKVEAGVTRSIREEETMTLNGLGRTLTRKTIKTITATPAS